MFCTEYLALLRPSAPGICGPQTPTYLRAESLRRIQNDVVNPFHATFPTPFPHGYGKNMSAFGTYETDSDAWVEFAVVDGQVAGFSHVVDQETVAARRRRQGGTLECRSNEYQLVSASLNRLLPPSM